MNRNVWNTGSNSMICACLGSMVVGWIFCWMIHGDPHEDRQDVVGVLHRQVLHPQEERRLPELDGHVQDVEERDEHGDLEEHRQAAAYRVHLPLLVEFHELLVEPLPVVGVLLL